MSAPEPASQPAWRTWRAWLIFLIPAVLGAAGDLYLKAYAFPRGVLPWDSAQGFPPPQGRNPAMAMGARPWEVLDRILGFQTTVNYGAVFGQAQGYGTLFIGFSFVALAVILYVFAKSRAKQWVLQLALGLITAGALGNLYDRLVFGCVRDMLKLLCFQFGQPPKDYYPYIFNLADVFLCIGVPLLMLVWMLAPQPGKDAGGVPAAPRT